MSGIDASDAISLLSFYLALVAILSSIFFTRLEGWYSEVQVAVKLWDIEPKSNPDLVSVGEHKMKFIGLQSARPILGFLLVSVFLLLISIFAVQLGNMIRDSPLPLSFIFVPGAIFDIIFFVGSILLLEKGEEKIENSLAGVEIALGKG
jgi:hypothetical protein